MFINAMEIKEVLINRAILYHLFGILVLNQLVILGKLNEKVLPKCSNFAGAQSLASSGTCK